MGRRKVKFVLPRLNDGGGKLTAKWYIEYSFRNEDNGKLERFRVYEKFKNIHTLEERYAYAEKIIKDIQDKILAEWSPFDLNKVVINNHIAYNIQSRVYRNREETGKNLFYYMNAFLEEKIPLLAKKQLRIILLNCVYSINGY